MFTTDDFLSFLRKNGYSEYTIRNYGRGVNSLLSMYGDITKVTINDIEQWKNRINGNARTVNLYTHAVKKYLFYLNYMGVKLKVDYNHILTGREVRTEQEYIHRSEVLGFVDNIEKNSKSDLELYRDKLLVRMLWETGARISELLNLQWGNFGEGFSIKLMGKGRKERIVFLSESTTDLMFEYKILRMSNNMNSIWVFASHSNNSKGGKLSKESAEKIIRKLNDTGRHITPHSFRHGFATHVLRNGGNLLDLQKTLGHSNIRTTSTYLHSCSERIHGLQKLAW